MGEPLNAIFDILGLFVGGRHGSENDIVRFGIGTFLWLQLFAIAIVRQRRESRPREKLLVVGFGLGLARESFMLALGCAYRLGLANRESIHVIFPPLEHALSNAAVLTVASAFLGYLLRDNQMGRRFVAVSLTAITICYLTTFWWWAQFIQAHPSSSFGQTWCDWLFRSTASILLLFPLVVLWRRTAGWMRNAICGAILAFVLNECLKLVDMALSEQYKTFFSPIRHALYLSAIPVLGYVYVRELIEERQALETKRLQLERQTQHAQKLKTLGVLSGSIAHDFNNILTVIRSFASVARQRLEPNHQAVECIHEIDSASRRAARLVKSLTSYSGEIEVFQEEVSLSSLVADLRPLLRAAVPPQISITTDLASNLPSVSADRSHVEQIVLNLVANAADAIGTAKGKIAITIDCRNFASDELQQCRALRRSEHECLQPGSYVTIRVEDDGCGMDTTTEERLFEPFFTTKGTGRGLGISSTLDIVRQHHGAVLLETQPDVGSTFQVLFPPSNSRSEPSSDAPLQAASLPRPYPTAPTWTVLVVDDNPQILRSASIILRADGFEVQTASNGREAVEMFVRSPDLFACVVLDLSMPLMGGEQTLRVLRAIRPNVKVLLSSGYAQKAVRNGMSSPPTDFLPKPYEAVDLLNRVRTICQASDDLVQPATSTRKTVTN